MDHAEATATHATDRYLLGDLSAAEADAFEEHYFDCADCAEELRIGMRFMNGGRDLAREAAEPQTAPVVRIDERRTRRKTWLPAAIAAALVLALATPLLLRNRAASGPTFEVASQQSFLLADSRGEADVPTLNGNAPIVLWADVPPEPAYARYEAHLAQPDGAVLKLPFTPDPNGDATPLTVRGLAAGRHQLVIAGFDAAGKSTEIARHPFVVRR